MSFFVLGPRDIFPSRPRPVVEVPAPPVAPAAKPCGFLSTDGPVDPCPSCNGETCPLCRGEAGSEYALEYCVRCGEYGHTFLRCNEHKNMGDCPVDNPEEAGDPGARDPQCAACVAMGPPVLIASTVDETENERAWAEADRLHIERGRASDEAERVNDMYRRAYDRAEATGPRPKKKKP